ncbi:MAG: hypothetical protein WCA10_23125 [Terracidiphilus sp.]
MALPLANPQELRESTFNCSSAVSSRTSRVRQLWHLASLDAPTVAVAWALAFAWALGVHLASWVPLLLACGTFTVYVGDRLLDAHRAIRSGDLCGLRERHYFHWRHRRSLIPLACATAAIAVALVVDRMPAAVRDRNSVLAAAALVYFSGVHLTGRLPIWLRKLGSRKLVSKELIVGLLFTAGCIAPAIARVRFIGWPFCACFTIFAMLAWINCSAIESWESSRIPSRISLRTTVLAIASVAASGAMAFLNWRLSALACSAAISALLLSLLDRKRAAITPLTLRSLADVVLLTPLLAVLLGANHG